MFRWAKSSWASLSAVEKQALRSDKRTTPLVPFLSEKTLFPPRLHPEQRQRLSRITDQMRDGWGDHGRIAQLVRTHRLMGMETPVEQGGMGEDAYFHSKFLQRLATLDRDGDWLHRIMVPNSLGPAQLLLAFGTPAQRADYVAALARGDKTPCFALTGPHNGSDAAAMPVSAHVTADGQSITFSCVKRWITLSPVANLLGVAVRVRDHGITLLLLDLDKLTKKQQERVHISSHRPIGANFPNGFVRIDELTVPIETAVIGGRAQLGKGWTMLMACLQHGRGISLPSVALGGTSSVLWHTLMYAQVRRQFKQPLSHLYAVQRMIAEMTLRWHVSDALNDYYHALLRAGHASSSLSALLKWTMTAMHREVVQNGMDVFAGKGISMGGKNPIAHFYLQAPIAITVEGANALTQHVIVPAQSLLEHHPHMQDVITALEADDAAAFYRTVLATTRHVVQDVLVGSLTDRDRSRVAFWQYRCLVEGGRLRHRQDLSRALANATVALVLKEAVRWRWATRPNHKILCTMLLHHIEARWVQERAVTPLEPAMARFLTLKWFQGEGLHDLAALEEHLVGRDPTLTEARAFWTQHGHWNVPQDLADRVVEVDTFASEGR
ncbi:hypothetical protein EBZ80_16015 [bacterium]|nr:hypothetical protein [bacterium]